MPSQSEKLKPGRAVEVIQVKRRQLFEFQDFEWMPSAWRDVLTDFLTFFAVRFNVYRPLLSRLEAHLQRLHVSRIIELCSGSSGPARAFLRHIQAKNGQAVNVLLTDKYPNHAAFKRIKEEAGGPIDYLDSAIDATAVPEQLTGFRTLFASFHHFNPDQARKILQNAVDQRQGIAVFEYTQRNFFIWALPILFTPFFIWLCMPFVRPLTWRHLLWTYLVPVVPLIAAWDGLVSCIRTYTPMELQKLAGCCHTTGYEWEIGQVRSFGACQVTYLFGFPL